MKDDKDSCDNCHWYWKNSNTEKECEGEKTENGVCSEYIRRFDDDENTCRA